MANAELDEFYKFWQSLQAGDAGVIRPFGPSSHSTITQPPNTDEGGGIAKLFSLQDFELFDSLIKNNNISPPDWTSEKINKTADMAFSRINETNGAEDWLQFVLLLKFYVKDKTVYKEYTDKTEKYLYVSKDSTQLKEGYAISKNLQLVFNIQRVHNRFTDNIKSAELILDDLTLNWINTEKGSGVNILYQNFIFYLCTKSWEKAILNFRKLWQTVNLMSSQDKYNYGAWDIWTCSLILCWYFALHNAEFNDLISSKLNLHSGSMLSNKKLMLVTTLTPDQIRNMLPDGYYDHVCELISLPK